MNRTTGDIDERREALRLRALQRRLETAERDAVAMQAALAEHPVSAYVKRLPVDPPLYPAIEYLKSADQEKGQEDPRELLFGERPASHRSFITWCMPAHDLKRPSQKRCGFIRSESGGVVFTACTKNRDHFLKAKRRHCWSLRCPQCMNDTALKRGIAIERQLLVYQKLSRKKGIEVGRIGHWVISPPQELAKSLCQTKEEFDEMAVYVDDSLMAHGAFGGVTIFHPWRQREANWEFSPHFHSLCYGRIDTDRFRRDNPGWIIKKVHAREQIRSIRHTAAYLLTHMGLGMSEKDPAEVNWELKILDYFDPGILSPGAGFSEKDYDDMSRGKGRMVGDLTGFDWVEWTKSQLTTDFKIRYWGGASKRNIRTVGVFRQYKIRVCEHCKHLLRTFDGCNDERGNYVRYIQDNPVLTFAADAQYVRAILQSFKSRLREEGVTLHEFSQICPLTVCTLDLGLTRNNDLIMSSPFEEPDEYFLRRQKCAFGTEEPVSAEIGVETSASEGL